jgi:AraC-like DNA-binding protein/mannose-6-phosphate isomerase-like protein (cupin superfamily)
MDRPTRPLVRASIDLDDGRTSRRVAKIWAKRFGHFSSLSAGSRSCRYSLAVTRAATAELERYTAGGLLAKDAAIRVMRPELRLVDVHWHDFYELVFVTSGSAVHVVNGVSQTVEPGDAFLLTPTDFHEIRADGQRPLECYNIVVDPQVAERQLDDLLPSRTTWPPAFVSGFDEAEPDFRRLWEESRAALPGSAALMESVLKCILVELLRRRDPADAAREQDHLTGARAEIRRAVLYVDRHFREPLTLAEVAGQAHLSPNYFSERFRQSTGTPFQEYLQQRRLRFARSLLVSTNLGVTEVCHAAGFNSPSYFGRAYRRFYDEAPSTRGDTRSRLEVAPGYGSVTTRLPADEP